MKPERVVLVLSGGGMKAMAHVGAVRALEQAGVIPAEIVATSAGALIGAMVAGGMPYERLVATACGIRRDDLFHPNSVALLLRGLGAPSVLDPDKLRAFLAAVLPAHDFAKLSIPLRVIATDLDAGASTVFGAAGRTDCSVVEAVYASMALSLYLPPALIGGRRFADGGLLAVLPLDEAASIAADHVIAVDVGPVPAAPPPTMAPVPALLAAHDRAMAIMMADQRARQVAAWEADPGRPRLTLITPAVDPHGTFAFERTVDFIEAGYRATADALTARPERELQIGN